MAARRLIWMLAPLTLHTLWACALPHAPAPAFDASTQGDAETDATDATDATSQPDAIDDTAVIDVGQDADSSVEQDVIDAAIDGPIDAAPDSDARIDARADAGADVARDASGIDARSDGAADAADARRDVAQDVAVDSRPDAPADSGGCPGEQTLCSGACVDLKSSLFHCGMCGNACTTSTFGLASCEAGFCALRCNPGYRYTESGGSAACVADATADASTCPGQNITVSADSSTTVVGTTQGRNSARVGVAACGALTGPEAIFQVTARTAGTLRVSLTSFEPLGVYVLGGACIDGSAGTSLGCSYTPVTATSRGRVQSLVLEASMNQVFTIVVDSPVGAPQPFALTVTHESDCGLSLDAVAPSARTCGDRNSAAGDGCSAMCTVEGGFSLTSCPAMPSVRALRVETTPLVLEGAWSAGGSFSACGAGHTRGERIYAVDVPTPTSLRIDLDPVAAAQTAISVRRAAACGSAMGESCGDNVDSTGAGERVDVSTTVANERLWVIADSNTDTRYSLRITPHNCGDGLLGPDEECDDRNATNGDGCDSMCRVEARCSLTELTDSTLGVAIALPSDCPTVRYSGALNPMAGMDLDDTVRLFLRAGETVQYQVASMRQGNCPASFDPVLEVSRGTSASVPMTRNDQCANGLPSLCIDDSATYCPEGRFAAPVDDWYTFRVYRYQDVGALVPYQLLFTRL